MRYSRLIPPLLALLALCCACSKKQAAVEADYVLYFLADEQTAHGPALGTEPYLPREGEPGLEGEEEPNPGALLGALTAGPRTETLRSPFPARTTFQWWEWDPERPGHLRVSMSEQYGGLTDISLTLADYCIVLTLAQVEGVESVEILSAGRSISYRSHQDLTSEEAELTVQPERAGDSGAAADFSAGKRGESN